MVSFSRNQSRSLGDTTEQGLISQKQGANHREHIYRLYKMLGRLYFFIFID